MESEAGKGPGICDKEQSKAMRPLMIEAGKKSKCVYVQLDITDCLLLARFRTQEVAYYYTAFTKPEALPFTILVKSIYSIIKLFRLLTRLVYLDVSAIGEANHSLCVHNISH